MSVRTLDLKPYRPSKLLNSFFLSGSMSNVAWLLILTNLQLCLVKAAKVKKAERYPLIIRALDLLACRAEGLSVLRY